MTLREQIEALPEPHAWGECVKVQDVLDIIDQHEQAARESIEEDLALQSISPPRSHVCIPDRDALARALHPATCWNNEFGCMGVEDHFDEADAIIDAMEKQNDPA